MLHIYTKQYFFAEYAKQHNFCTAPCNTAPESGWSETSNLLTLKPIKNKE